MTVVVDASVVLKWLLRNPQNESETERATLLMQRILTGEEPIIQPAHWLIEVGAVLARVSPDSVQDDVLMLQALSLAIDDGPEVMRRACRLAVDLDQHLFDTLYHAVALETDDAVLVTADERYLGRGRPFGRILGLAEWQPR